MAKVKKQFDASLPSFDSLPVMEWETLVVGNGLSINLWDAFAYRTLREEATLTPEADQLFAALDTVNFEEVLAAVHHSYLVLDALHVDTAAVEDLYAEIRDRLFQTIRNIHVPWSQIPTTTHERIARSFTDHNSVFTTNYDLIAYWSYIQELREVKVADLFWGPENTFDPSKTEIWAGWTGLYYLHGAIHLWQDTDGANGKWRNSDGRNLLEIAGRYVPSSSRRPLFVSEGTWQAKRQAIRQSAYLSHCYRALVDDNRNTVILGHSLSDWDQHVVDALAAGEGRTFAVSIYPHRKDEEIVQAKARITTALQGHEVYFYNSETHALGDPQLRVP